MRTIGRSSALFAAVGGAWTIGSTLSESIRGTDDTLNTVVGACSSALVVGVYGRSPLLAAGAALAMSGMAIIVDLSGGHLDQRSPKDFARLMTFHGAAESE